MVQHLAKRAEAEKSSLAPDIDELSNLASSTIISAHDIALGLLPVELRRGDFRGVLKSLSRSAFRAHHVRLKIRFTGASEFHPEGRAAEHLYRIAQESISNAIKHGRATRITVSMHTTPQRITFTISDDGQGFTAAGARHGLGLQIMRYRMQILKGRLTVRSRHQGGTQVICVVPREMSRR
jgi:signal transduction histidine kinase